MTAFMSWSITSRGFRPGRQLVTASRLAATQASTQRWAVATSVNDPVAGSSGWRANRSHSTAGLLAQWRLSV